MIILDSIVIGPLRLIFEFIFSISYKLTGSLGLSIVALSFVLNILLLPLYKKADEIQAEENEIQSKMKPDIDFIKKTFSGDEQLLLLQTYYRQHNYKPIYTLRSSISLLLQIPFFIAAYSFLSNLKLLEGASFGSVVSDLSKPDGLLFGLNLFPILMTLINLASCVVYTKGQPLKSQLQLYIMALLFLVLLYNAPSALSFYYLLNNLFSLLKNILYKFKNKHKIIATLAIILCVILILRINPGILQIKGKILVYGLLTVTIVLCILILFDKLTFNTDFSFLKHDHKSFVLCTIYLFILTGFIIPNSVIKASPDEFINKFALQNPLHYVFNTSLLAFGLFVLWLNIFYSLMENKSKKLLNVLLWILVGTSTLCYMFFNNNLGTMSNTLVYDKSPSFTVSNIIINMVSILILSIFLFLIWLRKTSYVKSILVIICVSSILLSSIDILRIQNRVNDGIRRMKNNIDSEEQILPLSKTQKNVIVLMLDRAISEYFPYIINERPELQEQFAGFTYYPNTISFGAVTNVGAPGLFGGYEYTPEEMNKRDTELLVDKHNEALKVMPVLFDENGFRVVVCDPPYAGYSWIPDLSIYDDYPNIKAYMTEERFSSTDRNELDVLNKKLFLYSLSKISPTALFSIIYDDGRYLNLDTKTRENDEIINFRRWFDVIDNLDYMTYFTNDDKGSFLMIQNSAPHNPLYLAEPDYVIDNSIDQTNNEVSKTIESINGDILTLNTRNQVIHYDVNVATMMGLGRWLDFLRENDVYDNTRIIVVSDHAWDLYLSSNTVLKDSDLKIYDDIRVYNCLLLHKDFNNIDNIEINYNFMTNADTPFFATNEVIENNINPFTGNRIETLKKEGKEFHVFGTRKWEVSINNGNVFLEDNAWYSVHDDCLDISNWKIISDPKG